MRLHNRTQLRATLGSLAGSLALALTAPNQVQGQTVEAAAPLESSSQPSTVRLAGAMLEVLAGPDGQVLDQIPLSSEGVTLFQTGDIAYVFHKSSFSIFRISSRRWERHLVYSHGGKTLRDFQKEGLARLVLRYEDESFEELDIHDPAHPARRLDSSDFKPMTAAELQRTEAVAKAFRDKVAGAKTLIAAGAVTTAIGIPLTVLGALYITCHQSAQGTFPSYCGVSDGRYSADAGLAVGLFSIVLLGFGGSHLLAGIPMLLAGVGVYPSAQAKPVAIRWNIAPYATAGTGGLFAVGRF